MKEITYVGPLQAAFVASIIAAIASFVGTIVWTVIPGALGGTGLAPSQILVAFLSPLWAGAITFVTTALSCAAYNWAAARFGGIKVRLV